MDAFDLLENMIEASDAMAQDIQEYIACAEQANSDATVSKQVVENYDEARKALKAKLESTS